MTLLYGTAAFVAFILLAYLVVALLGPESFS